MAEQQDMKADADEGGKMQEMGGQSCPRCGYGGHGMGGGKGGGMGGGMSGKSESGSESGKKAETPRAALDILDERFARGEIEKEEYIEKKTLISQRAKPE
ncbi:SHOCT domain-containing protein [Roseiarcaceae bacterium H3SJ34-1]|uniref:hypothetical protein n=1 Tax=Terripilifer ovatus TaxID=3032367 RepID=UPI003AB9ADE5|nr:SHOCT domain-containing protein [Roseiarcaceae bacterium H3SJ34-1]